MSSGHTTSRALRTRRRAAVNGGVAEQATGGGALPRSRMDVRRTSRLRTPSPQVPTRPLPPAHPVSAVGRPSRGATCRDRSSRTQQPDHRHQRGPVRTSAQSTTPRNVVNRGHHRAACSGADEVVKLCAQLVGTEGAAVVATRVVHGSIIVLSAVSNAHPGRRGHGPLGLQTAAALTFTLGQCRNVRTEREGPRIGAASGAQLPINAPPECWRADVEVLEAVHVEILGERAAPPTLPW